MANAKGCKLRRLILAISSTINKFSPKIHAIKGGFEKYPKFNSLDHARYCASSIAKGRLPKNNG